MIVGVPALVSMYVVEQFPENMVLTTGLKLPVLLFVLQITVPVGLEPNTAAVQVTGKSIGTGFTENFVDMEDCASKPVQGWMSG